MKQPSKAIVIGAGIAGIATAIRLAVAGFEVHVYEKNNYPGGKLSHFKLGDYNFDAGPSLFTQPHHIQQLFDIANEPINKYFTYTAVPISCKYFYEDGTIVNAFTDTNKFAQELYEKLNEPKNALSHYLLQSKKIYENIASVFLNFSLHKSDTLFKAPIINAIKYTKLNYLLNTMNGLNNLHFKNSKTVQLFNRYATYNGSNPYKAPAMLTLIPHLEHNEGVYYPTGGMISITNALYQLAIKKGVHFYFNSAVEKIIKNDKKIIGIVTNQKIEEASVVISNMDVYFTYKHLLNEPTIGNKILKQERSSSALIFYWGINKQFSELELHNIFFTENYEAEFDALFTTKKLYTDPTVYINITSKCEDGIQAPQGKENWFVMVNAPANVGQDWVLYKKMYRKAIIQKLNKILKTDIESLIEVEEVLDPITIESKTASFMGSLYGTSSNSKFAAFFRHPNFSKKLKGLYFVGGSVHPGGGIPLCMQSAKITTEIIVQDLKKIPNN